MKTTLPVEKNQQVTIEITALNSEGQGVGRVEGYAVFVPGALPGERVRALIIKAGSGYGVGKLLEVVTASPERVTPECPCESRCGGCTLQHLSYDAQLACKKKQVEDAFLRLGKFENVTVQPVLGMEETPWQYRNKGSFPVGLLDGRVEIGFFAPRSHRLIPQQDCLIEKESVVLAAQTVRDWAEQYHIRPYDEETQKGLLRHVVARVTTAGVVMVTVVAAGALPHKGELIDMLRSRVEGLKSIYLNINDAPTNVITGKTYQLLWGEATIEEELLGLKFTVHPASFLQVNSLQTQKLYQTALDLLELTGNEQIVDAYCGIGTISLLAAKHAKQVIGIETVAPAIEDAKKNAALNGIENVRFICAPAEEMLPKLVQQGEMLDALIADPPRKGCEKPFLDAVIASGVPKMAYVSCNPATLARDCRILADGGFTVEYIQPVDMFPHTAHVEAVVLLRRGNSTKSNMVL